ncbi:hypothetical protein LPTSP3_g37860 [Leptospira kobayashii]|uniref:DUF1574 domain-containing protein n=1 Tax=Leptospira kobayashii TaxID=1917830 RepID=A0ABM7UTV6_9LEPT|nr:hypothetical protein LPTSP3_g37860 [Leptospira kobayashii]
MIAVKSLFASLKFKAFAIFILLSGATFFLDYLVFEKLYFLFPSEMEWDTSPWYNFEKKRRNIKSEDYGNQVLIAGSSVALYSALPEEMNEKTNGAFHADFYSHVAMAPSDLYYYKENLSSLKPKLVVYLVNFADFQWEYVDFPNGKLQFDKTKWLLEFADRYPAKTFYPTSYLFEYFSDLDRKRLSKLAGKSLFYVSRYRSFFWDPIDAFIENHFRSGRSFHRYEGSLPKEGIWAKGWTLGQATMACETGNKQDDSVFIPKANTKIEFSVFSNSQMTSLVSKKEISFSKSGWTTINWQELGVKASDFYLRFRILEGMNTAKEVDLYRTGLDYPVGIRLSHYFCKTPVYNDRSYSRKSYFDESRFQRMSSAEYDKDYFQRMLENAEHRNELHRLRLVHSKKQEVNNLGFEPWLEVDRVLQLSTYFKEKNIPFLVIFSPENPVEASLYSKGKWFAGLKNYLKNGLDKNGHELYDRTNYISDKRLFFDPHHLTYEGASYFQSDLYAIISANSKTR